MKRKDEVLGVKIVGGLKEASSKVYRHPDFTIYKEDINNSVYRRAYWFS